MMSAMNELTGSEALFGFCVWLTSREQPVTLSSRHDAAIVAELLREFCARNNLAPPREGWEKRLAVPAR
jgi:hypothetical protein